MGESLRLRLTPAQAAIFAVLVILAVLFLLPTVGVLLSSVKPKRDIAMGDLWSAPSSFYLQNFTEVLSNPAVRRYFLNTVLVTVPATILSITLVDRIRRLEPPEDRVGD